MTKEPPLNFVVPWGKIDYLPEVYGVALGRMIKYLNELVEIEVVTTMNSAIMTLKNYEPKWEKTLVGDEAEAWQTAFEDVEVADLVRRDQVREIFDEDEIRTIPTNQFIGVLIRCTTKRDNEGKEIRKKVRATLRGDLVSSVKDLFPERHDTYPPTLRWSTFFMLVAIAAYYRYTFTIIDVAASFAYN